MLLSTLVLIFFYPNDADAKTVIKQYQYITKSTVWTAAAGPYIIEDYVNVSAGVKLTIQPGTIIKFYEKAAIYFDGELLVAGTAEAPVIFTSIYDDATGGDDSPNSNKVPVPGIWGDIAVRGAGKLNIDNAIFKYGGNDPGWVGLKPGVIFILSNGTVNITNSIFTQNFRAIYNLWNVNNTLTISNSKIFNNSLGGIYNNTAAIGGRLYPYDINAINNWWGDASGPYEMYTNPLGRGDMIYNAYDPYRIINTNRVAFDPWTGKVINKAPILSYSQEEKYRADSSLGVYPVKGDASLTDFVFKIVYSDVDNDAPKNMSVVIQREGASSTYVMNLDNATDTVASLHDGNYVNGEQYLVSMKLPQGKYQYYFTAADAKFNVRYPQTGELQFESGYSNIVFLPGLEASRLYKQGTFFENQLWEPNRNADVEKLFLDSNGKSLDQNIYTRDVIDEVNVTPLGQMNIYKKFLESLDKMVADKTINEYRAMPYDWRQGIDEIINNNVKTDVGSYSIIGELETLAATSQTGKVTIVAHSMGGLVAKRLIQRLTELGEQALVDKLILVAVPQAGTPSSVAALLHGDGQDLALGLLLNKATARGLGENMKSAYALLPSTSYFANAEKPLITFNTLSGSALGGMISNYGTEINSPDILSKFLLGIDGRIKPESNNTDAINVLSDSLLSESVNLHNSIDAWTPPAGLKVYQIAGWGLDTIAGIRYKEKQEIDCPDDVIDLSYCVTKTYYDREPIFSVDGDRTVMISSAVAMGGTETYYLDLGRHNDVYQLNISRDHKNILEVDSMQVFVNKIIKNNNLSIMPNYISDYRPDLNNSSLRVSIHSPVSLDVYNSTGQHVGKIKNPNLDSDLEMTENQIPNSYYMNFGEGKYVGVGGGDKYQLDLKGLDYGTFTLDITEVSNGGEKTITYKDIPVTPSSIAKMSIEDLASTSVLEIDMNGDGKIDFSIGTSQDSIDPAQYIMMIQQYILNIDNDQHARWELLEKLDVLNKFIDKKEIKGNNKNNRDEKKIEELLNSAEKHVIVISDKIIDRKQAKILLNMLNNLRELLIK